MIREEFHEIICGAPPDGWKLGHVTVQLFCPNERIPVEAWVRGAFAVHETMTGATLTHAPTGLAIWRGAELDQLVTLAEAIEGMADWSRINNMMPCGSELYPKVRAVIDRICPHQ